ncbi:MAG: molecular chaperone [Pseudomonadota bacterium]
MRKFFMLLMPAAFTWAGLAIAADAPGLSISPVRVDLSAGHKADAITVTNTGPTRKVLETEVLRWTQVNGEDVYEPATDLRANPPRLSVEPGATQIVRVGLIRTAVLPEVTEGAYRIYFQEVPQVEEAAGSQLKFALRIGIPVFVRPAQAAKPELAWTHRRENGALKLIAANRGQLHARVADVRARTLAGEVVAEGFRYVLPGASREWSIPQFSDQPLSVSALGELGRVEYRLEASAH